MASVRKKAKKPTLARPGDPLVLEDGRLAYPEKMPVHVETEQPELTASDFKPMTQRNIRDLPVEPQAMKGIACVLVFSILGLSEGEIAEAMQVDISAVERAKEHQAYGEAFQMLAAEFINANSELIAARIASYGHAALTSVADVAINGKQEGNKMRAGMYLLDAGGHNKKGNVGGQSEDGLRIIVSEGDKTVEVSVNGLGGL